MTTCNAIHIHLPGMHGINRKDPLVGPEGYLESINYLVVDSDYNNIIVQPQYRELISSPKRSA